MKDIIEEVDGVVVECNTAYEGARNTTNKHQKLMQEHGWNKYYQIDITDSHVSIIAFQVTSNGRLWWSHKTIIHRSSIQY